LPVISFDRFDHAISIIHSSPHPLAAYFFSNNTDLAQKFIDKVQFGGGCINNTLVHLVNPELPFGGVGNSGLGAYHGKTGFDTFSHMKSVVKSPFWLDIKIKYPPYRNRLKFMKMLFR
jgi:aldehyde dehydrogenase (NAD+)